MDEIDAPSQLTPDEESPAWHLEILRDREKALAAGKITFSDWEEAKKRIRRSISRE